MNDKPFPIARLALHVASESQNPRADLAQLGHDTRLLDDLQRAMTRVYSGNPWPGQHQVAHAVRAASHRLTHEGDAP